MQEPYVPRNKRNATPVGDDHSISCGWCDW